MLPSDMALLRRRVEEMEEMQDEARNAVEKLSEAVDKLRAYRQWLATREPFDAAALDAATQAWLGERGWALGDIVHAVRVAVTGLPGGPGLFDCLALIGRDVCVRRIDRALARAKS